MDGLVVEHMRIRSTAFAALVAVLVLGMTSVAFAGTATPTISASKTALTYPHSALLAVTAPTTPTAIVRRLADESEWTTLVAGVEATVATYALRPTGTAAYAAVCNGVSSDPVTITVAAQLSKPQVNNHGHKGRRLSIKGWVAPMHVGGTVQLTFSRWEKVGTKVVDVGRKGKTRTVAKFGWAEVGDPVTVSMTRMNSTKSRWSYRWTPPAKGSWKVVVSHEDAAHVRSSAGARTVIKR
jgi:hypothetical protein